MENRDKVQELAEIIEEITTLNNFSVEYEPVYGARRGVYPEPYGFRTKLSFTIGGDATPDETIEEFLRAIVKGHPKTEEILERDTLADRIRAAIDD